MFLRKYFIALLAIFFTGCSGCQETDDKNHDVWRPTYDLESDDTESEDDINDESDIEEEDVPEVEDDIVEEGDGVEQDDAEGSDGEETCERLCEENEDCDDNNPCTEDYCAPLTGCCAWFTEGLNYTLCGDDIFCNGTDYCVDGVCVHEAVYCPECGVCTEETCIEELETCQCVPLPRDTPCDDGLWCTEEDNVCDGDGNCRYGHACPMFHENPCWTYTCMEEEDRCEETPKPNGEQCSDDEPCNGTEFCWEGACNITVRPCIDDDPCTDDICDFDTGECIIPAPIIGGCDYCTSPSVCDDGDPCTDDYCRIMHGGPPECEHIFVPACI